MTKKHFTALAEALAHTRPHHTEPGVFSGKNELRWEATRNAIADVCARFNPNFDRERFIAATEA